MKATRCLISVAALCAAPFALVTQAGAAELNLPRNGWASWEVPAVDDAPAWCCLSWNGKGRDVSPMTCRLDRKSGANFGYGSHNDETTDIVRLYVRMAGGKVDRLHAFAAACPVEAATPIERIENVIPDDSARWLIDLVGGKSADEDLGEDALAALAMHRGKVAGDALAGIARDRRKEIRKHAVFWLSQLRGAEGAGITSSVMFNDPDPEVREHAAFSLSQTKSPSAAADLIRLGNTDTDDKVRAQAWFWLAQTGAAEAETAIVAALRKDADSNVREEAIFALSQLPDERATRALIAAAEDRSLSHEQRKQAVFWLSQSSSDAAQAYLDKVLSGVAPQ
jgi:HEAT repeat protein